MSVFLYHRHGEWTTTRSIYFCILLGFIAVIWIYDFTKPFEYIITEHDEIVWYGGLRPRTFSIATYRHVSIHYRFYSGYLLFIKDNNDSVKLMLDKVSKEDAYRMYDFFQEKIASAKNNSSTT